MKLITRDTDYAVRAICYIAKSKNELVSAEELVKKLRIPRPFLRKILQILNKKKILQSYKGKGGGFSLAIKADDIRLISLMKIFQGDFRLNECTFKKTPCSNIKICPLRKKIDSIQTYIVSQLKDVTIGSLLKK